jgi:signal transduction histidine kinase
MQQMFTAFFTTKAGGMGLGLAISRSIIEAHEGQITALPNANQGATVFFTLPLEEETA